MQIVNENVKKNTSDNGLSADALSHVQIFNDEGLIYGIPTTLFWGGIALSAALSLVVKWWLGIPFAFVYFIAMSEIHKDDPKAFQSWIDAALNRRKEIWVTGLHKQRNFKILDRK